MKTKRVRIAVCIDEDGAWNAAGWRDAIDGDVSTEALDGFEGLSDGGPHHTVWVTAEVPLPELPDIEVEGKVE